MQLLFGIPTMKLRLRNSVYIIRADSSDPETQGLYAACCHVPLGSDFKFYCMNARTFYSDKTKSMIGTAFRKILIHR